MLDVLVVSGAGPYADPWHDFPATSARLAGIVRGLGLTVEVSEDVEASLANPDCGLLIANIGEREPRPPSALAPVRAGLERHLAAGGGLLGVHSSAIALAGLPAWAELVGGRWVRDTTMHPQRGRCTFSLVDGTHPVATGLADIDTVDERYSYLVTEPDITVLYDHEHDGLRHPVVWAREAGGGRVVYSALGHDPEAYDSAGHFALLRQAIGWLLPAAHG